MRHYVKWVIKLYVVLLKGFHLLQGYANKTIIWNLPPLFTKSYMPQLATHNMQCYHGLAERGEEAGKFSHNTQSELLGNIR